MSEEYTKAAAVASAEATEAAAVEAVCKQTIQIMH